MCQRSAEFNLPRSAWRTFTLTCVGVMIPATVFTYTDVRFVFEMLVERFDMTKLTEVSVQHVVGSAPESLYYGEMESFHEHEQDRHLDDLGRCGLSDGSYLTNRPSGPASKRILSSRGCTILLLALRYLPCSTWT